MWAFKGKYTGGARTYIKTKKKKQGAVLAIAFSVFYLLVFVGLAIVLSGEDLTFKAIILSIGAGAIILTNLVLFLYYNREPVCEIQITNDSFQVYDGHKITFSFYKIESIDECDDFIIIKDSFNKIGYVLQKELLIDGEWEELKAFLKKVKESLDTDEPVYQIDEPKADFFEATVKSKRIYKRFEGEVRMQRAVYDYFATFVLESGEEVEYEIGSLYEKIEQGEVGTLVLINGKFFSFGAGEDAE